jgi:hypothetical protein
MIADQPHASDLLVEARRELMEEVFPDINSEHRYKVLMVLRAMELAERELHSDRDIENELIEQLRLLVDTDTPESSLIDILKQQLRDGRLDASEKLYKILQLIVAFKLRVTNPLKVSEDLENRLNGLLDQSS